MMKEGPLKQHMDRDPEGQLQAEYTTYTVKDGVLIKETSIRNYKASGDYNDSFISNPLHKVK